MKTFVFAKPRAKQSALRCTKTLAARFSGNLCFTNVSDLCSSGSKSGGRLKTIYITVTFPVCLVPSVKSRAHW